MERRYGERMMRKASKNLDELLGRGELVKMMEEYTVPMLVEMTERKLIGVLESKQLGFLDYSCIANAVWSEKKFLSHQQHTKQRAPHMLVSQGFFFPKALNNTIED